MDLYRFAATANSTAGPDVADFSPLLAGRGAAAVRW
jgi:hypothetical protein